MSKMKAITYLLLALVAAAGVLPGCSTAAAKRSTVQTERVPAPAQVSSVSQAQPAPPMVAAAPAPMPAAAAAAEGPRSTAAQLQRLIRDNQVVELRTTYNDTYGASLLFKADDLTFYVTLFQDKNFWRVFKTSEERLAQDTYHAFVAQSQDLAAADIRRIILQAQSARDGQQLAEHNAQLSRLQADQALRVQQDAEVARQQQRAGQDVQALTSQQLELAGQLQTLRRQIEILEAQQASIGQQQSPERLAPRRLNR
jgi:hypothetical protein